MISETSREISVISESHKPKHDLRLRLFVHDYVYFQNIFQKMSHIIIIIIHIVYLYIFLYLHWIIILSLKWLILKAIRVK